MTPRWSIPPLYSAGCWAPAARPQPHAIHCPGPRRRPPFRHRTPVPGNATVRDLTFGPDGTIFYGSVDDFGYLTASPTGNVFAVSLAEDIPRDARTFADVWQVVSAADRFK